MHCNSGRKSLSFWTAELKGNGHGQELEVAQVAQKISNSGERRPPPSSRSWIPYFFLAELAPWRALP